MKKTEIEDICFDYYKNIYEYIYRDIYKDKDIYV